METSSHWDLTLPLVRVGKTQMIELDYKCQIVIELELQGGNYNLCVS